MGAGKDGDELRDRVIGDDGGKKCGFASPAKGVLIAGQLDPDGVDRIGGQYADIGHDETVVLSDHERVDR